MAHLGVSASERRPDRAGDPGPPRVARRSTALAIAERTARADALGAAFPLRPRPARPAAGEPGLSIPCEGMGRAAELDPIRRRARHFGSDQRDLSCRARVVPQLSL